MRASCPHCGEQIFDDDRFCAGCGRPVDPSADSDSGWSEILTRLRSATSGEYEIIRELGHGGMAVVYLAHELALSREVAIKVMAPGLLLKQGMAERFRREAITVAQLRHPNIVNIHAVREGAQLQFFVMEFVRGYSLEEGLRVLGALPIAVVQSLLFQIGGALGYAHRRGVIHRDVKPANILVDEEGNAIVTDFGIAKVAEMPSHTVTGVGMGTPVYMSPEQCDGMALTGASDQYSLGILAYEMLTGMPPFTGPSYSIQMAHATQQAPSVLERRPDCPPDLAAALARMLAKKPTERWPSIGDAVSAMGGRVLPDQDPAREALRRLAAAASRPHSARLSVKPVTPVSSLSPKPDTTGDRAARESISSIVILAPQEPLFPGDAVQLNVRISDNNGITITGRLVTWFASPAEVASISVSGLLTTWTAGRIKVTAACEELQGIAELLVREPAVARVVLEGLPESLHVEEEAQVAARVFDSRGMELQNLPVLWQSNGPSVASISESGLVACHAEGFARISGTCGGVGSSRMLRVLPFPVATISLNPDPRDLLIGETYQLLAHLTNADGLVLRDRALSWTSSQPAIIRVSADGVVTAVAEGTATILVTCEGQRASLGLVSVSRPIDTPEFPAVTVESGPSNAPKSVARKAQSEPAAPRVRRKKAGLMIAGTTVVLAIAAVAFLGGPEAGTGDTVLPPATRTAIPNAIPEPPAEASSIDLAGTGGNSASAIVIRRDSGLVSAPNAALSIVSARNSHHMAGDTVELRAQVAPASREGPPVVVRWSVEAGQGSLLTRQGNVVRLVGASGVVTVAARAGTSMARSRLVFATPVATRVVITGSRDSLQRGQTLALTAAAFNEGGRRNEGPVLWASSAPSVAEVSSAGEVTAREAGVVQITATVGTARSQVNVRIFSEPRAVTEPVAPTASARVDAVSPVRRAFDRDAATARLKDASHTLVPLFSPGRVGDVVTLYKAEDGTDQKWLKRLESFLKNDMKPGSTSLAKTTVTAVDETAGTAELILQVKYADFAGGAIPGQLLVRVRFKLQEGNWVPASISLLKDVPH
jgi:serine/threonine protein kinase